MHENAIIHLIFHVSRLKRCHELPVVITHPLVCHLSSPYCPTSETILDIVKRGNKVVSQVLVKWFGISTNQDTWEFVNEMQSRFLSFHS